MQVNFRSTVGITVVHFNKTKLARSTTRARAELSERSIDYKVKRLNSADEARANNIAMSKYVTS